MEIFGDLTPFIEEMKKDLTPLVESTEKILGYVVLKDGRRAEITVKINTNKDEWIE